MKAVVFHEIGDIRLEEVPDPAIEKPTDAIVRLTASAICGTDLHMVRGTVSGMAERTILGHEGVGIVEELGPHVRNFKTGDRVVIPSTIACGYCAYCRAGYFAQCDNANPNGSHAGTAFYGGPKETGPFQGLQAEKARIPFANVGLVKLPDQIRDDQAILLSDIAPTGYFGAKLAEIKPGETVAVFGCGPVGQFCIASARIMGAGRIFAVDETASRLDMARDQGAEVIDFKKEEPAQIIRELTGGIGVDRAIDAVGIDAYSPLSRTAAAARDGEQAQKKNNPKQETSVRWEAGDAPAQALMWAIDALAKAGTLAIVGVYPPDFKTFPIGKAMNMNLTIHMGNCNHRKYLPELINMAVSGMFDPEKVLTQREPLVSAIEAYQAFDQHRSGWMKVKLEPPAAH
ncbi:MAG: zinc-dependent alcohol dehydrogenase [Candidatus Binataceae bacterium]